MSLFSTQRTTQTTQASTCEEDGTKQAQKIREALDQDVDYVKRIRRELKLFEKCQRIFEQECIHTIILTQKEVQSRNIDFLVQQGAGDEEISEEAIHVAKVDRQAEFKTLKYVTNQLLDKHGNLLNEHQIQHRTRIQPFTSQPTQNSNFVTSPSEKALVVRSARIADFTTSSNGSIKSPNKLNNLNNQLHQSQLNNQNHISTMCTSNQHTATNIKPLFLNRNPRSSSGNSNVCSSSNQTR